MPASVSPTSWMDSCGVFWSMILCVSDYMVSQQCNLLLQFSIYLKYKFQCLQSFIQLYHLCNNRDDFSSELHGLNQYKSLTDCQTHYSSIVYSPYKRLQLHQADDPNRHKGGGQSTLKKEVVFMEVACLRRDECWHRDTPGPLWYVHTWREQSVSGSGQTFRTLGLLSHGQMTMGWIKGTGRHDFWRIKMTEIWL